MTNSDTGEQAGRRSNPIYLLAIVIAVVIVVIVVGVTGSGDDDTGDDVASQGVEETVVSDADDAAEGTDETEAGNVQEDTADSDDVAKSVSFGQPTDGARVPTSFDVVMRAEGFTIEPAGEVNEGAGHFHILIDEDFIEAGEVIPNDETHLHFGDGSIATTLELEPGSHTLRLQLANGEHIAQAGDEYRDEIVIGVVDGAAQQAVRFASPTDGATVPPTFTIIMAATGFTIEPAGEVNEGAGHFHILIDEDFIEAGEVIPNDETHRHFGSGVTSTELELEPGTHTLRLQLADGAHIAQEGDAYRDEITITVEEGAATQQVMFVGLEDGATVTSPVSLQWAAAGLVVEPAGQVLREDGGHLHVLINEDFVEAGEVIPNDETHRHFGGGQLGTELELEPGTYTLRLQMANGAHIAMDGEQYRDEVEITVE
ncbi:MAG: DUF4399 domain-containing protein [Chloroflexi bacterium]|nr:MAG: hypothetical protein CUN54_07010 [Phototrophicales bacterium]RMF78676.1 MAG: DUF4399 domain-containing protein [Chloroflexota bacterium]